MKRIKYLLMAMGILATLYVVGRGKTKLAGDKNTSDIATIVEKSR